MTAQVVNENAPSLRRLFVYCDADLLRMIEWQSLAGLQDLSLVLDVPMRLDAVFSHCSQLRSLSVICDQTPGRRVTHDPLLGTLRDHPNAFPILHSFKLFYAPRRRQGFCPDVAEFLRSKTGLKRLDLCGPVQDLDSADPILNVLPGLQHLEVLGLYTNDYVSETSQQLDCLRKCLPRSLTALYLNVYAQTSTLDAMGEGLSSVLSALPSLRYLHVVCAVYPRTRNMKDALAARLSPSLELFGYDADMHWVTPDTQEPPVLAPAWPWSKVYLRTVEEFGGEEDWEWLLRCHGDFGPESDTEAIKHHFSPNLLYAGLGGD
ncbi:hypothetical protein C8Q76DRAFT_254187 [Earliella scabrosa]|nr:hypothetical protein C8Q76DRAFT_254187 [Earliella scabrosa]